MKTLKMPLRDFAELVARLQSQPTITAYDCAKLLNITPQHVYQRAKAGEIKHVRIGTTVRIVSAPIRAQLGL
jgi:excisionase family DNA binding protein